MGSRDFDAAIEDGEFGEFDLAEEAEIDGVHDLGGEHGKAFIASKMFTGTLIVFTRARRLELHELDEFEIVIALQQIVLGIAKANEVFFRKIDPSLRCILLDVAQNVRELERDTKIDGVLLRYFEPIAKDLNANEADNAGDCIAVVFEFVEGLVAVAHEVHLDTIDQRKEILLRYAKASDDTMEGFKNGMRRGAIIALLNFGTPPCKSTALLLDKMIGCGVADDLHWEIGIIEKIFVDKIVSIAAKLVDTMHGIAFVAGQQRKGVIKIAPLFRQRLVHRQ